MQKLNCKFQNNGHFPLKFNDDDLIISRESRHSCESSPAFGGMDSRSLLSLGQASRECRKMGPKGLFTNPSVIFFKTLD